MTNSKLETMNVEEEERKNKVVAIDEEEQNDPKSVVTVADELEELYALNDSMFTGDPNHVPKFTDDTVIRPQDLADMNMNGLQRIAEMIGIELGD